MFRPPLTIILKLVKIKPGNVDSAIKFLFSRPQQHRRGGPQRGDTTPYRGSLLSSWALKKFLLQTTTFENIPSTKIISCARDRHHHHHLNENRFEIQFLKSSPHRKKRTDKNFQKEHFIAGSQSEPQKRFAAAAAGLLSGSSVQSHIIQSLVD